MPAQTFGGRMFEGFIVEEVHLKQPWMFGKDGIFFRCMMCGHRFEVGDYCRWYYGTEVFIEDGREVGTSNVMVCAQCEGECLEMGLTVAKRWALINEEVHTRYWYFVRPQDTMRRSDTDPWDSGRV